MKTPMTTQRHLYLFLAFALFCAVALPVFAGAATDSKNQDVTITVNKGIEFVSFGSQALAATTPTGTGDTNATTSALTASIRSNATWASTLASSTTATVMAENDARTGNETTVNSLQYSTDGSSFTNVTSSAAPATVKTGQTRNANNTALTYNYYFRYPVSWGDQTGDYKITMTHGASN